MCVYTEKKNPLDAGEEEKNHRGIAKKRFAISRFAAKLRPPAHVAAPPGMCEKKKSKGQQGQPTI